MFVLFSRFSDESAIKGFTIIIDNRNGFWMNLRTLLTVIQVRVCIISFAIDRSMTKMIILYPENLLLKNRGSVRNVFVKTGFTTL